MDDDLALARRHPPVSEDARAERTHARGQLLVDVQRAKQLQRLELGTRRHPLAQRRVDVRCVRRLQRGDPRALCPSRGHRYASPPMNSSSPAIEVEQLVREFRKGPRAVDGIDLAVSPGEIYGFLGPNGAGKSTTVLMLTTLLPPTSGRASVGGYDIVRQGSQVRASIGAALQEAALDAILTGREHLMLQATLQGMPKADRTRRAQNLLERVGLTEAADRRVGGYSGGMKRRLDLALALVHGPRILFLDEPTTGLDLQSRSALWEEVARLAKEEGMTVFLTTQYLEEADALADRVGIIDHGKIVAEGTPTQLKEEIGSPTVEVVPADAGAGDALAQRLASFGQLARNGRGAVTVQLPGGESQLAEIVRVLDQAHLKVASLQLHQPSLDDVFLAKTGRKLEGAGEDQDERQP
jgi:ABC-2 type transport system ATP-binding protein